MSSLTVTRDAVSPEGRISAPVGSLVMRVDGAGRGLALFVKEQGEGYTGWGAK